VGVVWTHVMEFCASIVLFHAGMKNPIAPAFASAPNVVRRLIPLGAY
jgi:hypothetical protein